jgi:hypothetical protein
MHSQIGALQNQSSKEGIKVAAQNFQVCVDQKVYLTLKLECGWGFCGIERRFGETSPTNGNSGFIHGMRKYISNIDVGTSMERNDGI